MNKIIIICAASIFIFTGCTLNNNNSIRSTVINGENKLSDMNYNDGDIIAKIHQLNNPNMQTNNNQSNQSSNAAGNQNNNMELENLSAKYNQAVLQTNFGNIKIQFYVDDAPLTVNNFLNLAAKGFYNGTKFHRVIPDFMIQGGDPNSKDDDWSNDGMGGPGYSFDDEINQHKLVAGSLAMANSGPNTNGSQFFIVTAESTPWLDGKHTNFGEVVEGMDVVRRIESVNTNESDHPTEDIVIKNIALMNSADDYKLNEGQQAELETLNKTEDDASSTDANKDVTE